MRNIRKLIDYEQKRINKGGFEAKKAQVGYDYYTRLLNNYQNTNLLQSITGPDQLGKYYLRLKSFD